jgi:hypothetical protein
MTDTLISRLEAALAGSRELDLSICIAIKRAVSHAIGPPSYTFSMDSAITLIPEGLDWEIVFARDTIAKPAEAFIYLKPFMECGDNDRTFGSSQTPPLALCIAALNCIAVLKTQHDG